MARRRGLQLQGLSLSLLLSVSVCVCVSQPVMPVMRYLVTCYSNMTTLFK